jgi:AcrR family transcriptional regulator
MATMTVRFRERVRRQLRDDVLDYVRELVIDRGWQAVRMGDVAAAVGVSRQTLYTEFGTKDALAEAVAMREAQAFFEGIEAELVQHKGDLGAAVEAAVGYTLRAGEDNPLLHAVLTAAHPGDDSLLPVLTSRGEPIFRAAATVLGEHIRQNYPDLNPQDVSDLIDTIVRATLSHLILRLDPIDVVSRRLARLAVRVAASPRPETPVSPAATA